LPVETSKLLVQVLRKIPLFRGLSPSQVKTVLGLCVHRTFLPGEVICQSNTASDEMYILLSGELVVATAEGIRVASLLPVTTVGEMGVITGQPRSATVEAVQASNIFVVQRGQFDLMLRDDRDLRAMVYRNIIDVLALKLNNDNVRLRDHQMAARRFEGRIAVFERRLREQEHRARLALDLLVQQGGGDRDELAARLDAQVKELVPHVLVVDDEPEFRRLVRQALPALAVVEAADGEEALRRVEEDQLDLVLTDLCMPGMDGFGLLANLRSRFPGLPVLAVSGYMDEEQVRGHDFDGFIAKPVSLPRLQELVEATIARRTGQETGHVA
jgi:CheY-like chemotaxis protein